MNMGKIVGFVLVVAVALGFKMFNKSQSAASVHDDMLEIVQMLPGYKKAPAAYAAAFETAHPEAFEDAYSLGGRRAGGSLNETEYFNNLFTRMIAHAKLQKNLILSQAMETDHKIVLAMVAASETQ